MSGVKRSGKRVSVTYPAQLHYNYFDHFFVLEDVQAFLNVASFPQAWMLEMEKKRNLPRWLPLLISASTMPTYIHLLSTILLSTNIF